MAALSDQYSQRCNQSRSQKQQGIGGRGTVGEKLGLGVVGRAELPLPQGQTRRASADSQPRQKNILTHRMKNLLIKRKSYPP